VIGIRGGIRRRVRLLHRQFGSRCVPVRDLHGGVAFALLPPSDANVPSQRIGRRFLRLLREALFG
jgi:hypothetical protein